MTIYEFVCTGCGSMAAGSLFGVMCKPCLEKHRMEQAELRTQKIINAATVVEWDGCALRELGGSEYFGGVEDLIQEFVYKNDTPLDELTLPRYMHPCDLEHIIERVSAHRLASKICDDLMDEFGVEVDHGMYWPEFNEESLTTHLGAWLRSQDIFFFKEDTSKIVDLKGFWDQVIADEKEAGND